MNAVTAQELKSLINQSGVVLLDVREDEEVQKRPFEGVNLIHIPMQQVPANLKLLEGYKQIVVACVVGGRSAHVCEFLNTQGFDNVSNLIGGITAWEEQ